MKRNASRLIGQSMGRICRDCNSISSRLLLVRSLSRTTNVVSVRHIYHESSQHQRYSRINSNGQRANSSSGSSSGGILELTESEFHILADDTLDELVDWLTVVEESEELDADIVLSVSEKSLITTSLKRLIMLPIPCMLFFIYL